MQVLFLVAGGKAIDETLLRNKSTVSFEEWLHYAVFKLEADLLMWPTMTNLINTLSEDSPEMHVRRTLFYRRFLANDGIVEIDDPINRPHAKFLTAEGALRHEGGSSYSVR